MLSHVITADADATKQFRRVDVGGVYWAYVSKLIVFRVQKFFQALLRFIHRECLILF